MDKSPDAYRTISEVADDLDLPQHVLRFWETRFGQIKPLKRAGGRRFYRPDDVDLLKGIRHLLYKEGYTIKGVQRILKEQGVRAVLTLVRETAFDPAAFPAPPAQPPLAQVGVPTASSPPPMVARREVPPPLEKPSSPPEWRAPRDMEFDFAAFHMQEEPSVAPPLVQDVPQDQPMQQAPVEAPPLALFHTPAPPVAAPLQSTLTVNGLAFGQGVIGHGRMLNVPLAATSPSKVSMFRGGITAPDKPEPASPSPPQTSTARELPLNFQHYRKREQGADETGAEPPTAWMEPQRAPRMAEEGEARAILALALQELATCRELIEDLRNAPTAAE